jgi:predicted thioredoxin/glutaredoxin
MSMRQLLNALITFHDIGDKVNLIEHDSEKEEAIDVAITYGIADIPGCYIDGDIVEGDDFEQDDIVSAMKKLADKLKNA